MTMFIELHLLDDDEKIIINMDRIKSVYRWKGITYVYDIGFEDGRAFQGDLITQGIGDVAEALVDIYKKEGREKARKGE